MYDPKPGPKRDPRIQAQTPVEAPLAFGERVRRLREAKGWSRAELARRIRVSGGVVGEWESAKIQTVKGPNLVALAEALGTTPAYLLTGEAADDWLREAAATYGAPAQALLDSAQAQEALALLVRLTPSQRAQELERLRALKRQNEEVLQTLGDSQAGPQGPN